MADGDWRMADDGWRMAGGWMTGHGIGVQGLSAFQQRG